MRALPHLSLVLLLPSLLAACGPSDPGDVCGLSGVPPTVDEVPNGFGQAMKDGEIYKEVGSWGAGPNATVEVGVLSMVIVFDETGTETVDLIARRAFPICVPLAERSATAGSANFVEGGYVTTEEHTGALAILGEEGGFLTGRFEVELIAPSTDDEMSITDGVFRVERR